MVKKKATTKSKKTTAKSKKTTAKKKVTTKKKAVKKVATKKKAAKKPTSPKCKGYTKKDIKAIRDKLVKEKAKIIEDLMNIQGGNLKKSLKDASGDLSGYSFHMADMATDSHDREIALNLAEGEREYFFALLFEIKTLTT